MSRRRTTKFGEWVRQRARDQGLENDKAIWGRLHAELRARGIEVETSTVSSKLSKLCAGDPEGRQLLQSSQHHDAFAAALGVDAEAVRRAVAESDDRRGLILDPSLAPEARSYLRERADALDAGFDLIEVEAANLREVVERARAVGPRSVVVLADGRDREKMDVAGVDSTTARRTRRGHYVLHGEFAHLVPEPPPAPPPTSHPELGALYPFAPDAPMARDVPRAASEYYGWRKPWMPAAREAIDRGE